MGGRWLELAQDHAQWWGLADVECFGLYYQSVNYLEKNYKYLNMEAE
jgi:hypothetical protein